jgi:hypothetical protein
VNNTQQRQFDDEEDVELAAPHRGRGQVASTRVLLQKDPSGLLRYHTGQCARFILILTDQVLYPVKGVVRC